jgi:hypothetical protein
VKIESGPKGRFLRVQLRGGKNVMHATFESERIVSENLEDSQMCLVTLTEGYYEFLGDHEGSLQPTCSASNGSKPHPDRVVGYSLALEDLRKIITLAG